MPLPQSESAYGAHKTAMEKALLEKNGIKVILANKRAATNFRHMCHTLRSRERSRLARVAGFEIAAVSTPYDCLIFRNVPGDGVKWEVHIIKSEMPEIEVL